MSTVKVTNLQHGDAASAAITLQAAGGAVYGGTHNFTGATVTGVGSPLYGWFAKADAGSVAFTKTGAGTVSVKAGTYVDVNGTLITFSTATAVTMPTLTAGTDYFIYVSTAGAIQAVAATGTWPTPVASPPANSRLIGGFHYAPGGNATGTSGGDTTPAINEYSMWDLKWKPSSVDPRGMTLVANKFWSDIYLLNRDPQTQGTSKYNVAIADGETGGTTTPIIPTAFGGNGSTRYAILSWYNAAECLGAFGKRLPSLEDFGQLAYGTTENSSNGTDPVNTTLIVARTSKWGVIQSTGVMWVWGSNMAGPYAAASWADTNGGRGQTYNQPNAVVLGGSGGASAAAGSRASSWTDVPSNSSASVGARGVCDHLVLV